MDHREMFKRYNSGERDFRSMDLSGSDFRYYDSKPPPEGPGTLYGWEMGIGGITLRGEWLKIG